MSVTNEQAKVLIADRRPPAIPTFLGRKKLTKKVLGKTIMYFKLTDIEPIHAVLLYD